MTAGMTRAKGLAMSAKKADPARRLIADNRRARFNY